MNNLKETLELAAKVVGTAAGVIDNANDQAAGAHMVAASIADLPLKAQPQSLTYLLSIIIEATTRLNTDAHETGVAELVKRFKGDDDG